MTRLRIRTIKPDFFEDEKVRRLSIQARFLLIGLITRADDRGRQTLLEHSIIGHVFPEGQVSAKQVGRWLKEIAELGVIKLYGTEDDRLLWFPHFWQHQRINRPSESTLPAHPEDRFAHEPITEALRRARGELTEGSLSNHCVDTESSSTPQPSRAGARSVPFLSSSEGGSTENGQLDADAISAVFAYWQEQCQHGKATLSPERRRAIRARLREGATLEELRTAIDGAAKAAHINDQGQRFDDIELICRNRVKLDSFIARAGLPRSAFDSKRERKAKDSAALSRLMGAGT